MKNSYTWSCLRKRNTSNKLYTGSTWGTTQGETLTIIGQIDMFYTTSRNAKSYRYFLVEFADKTRLVADASHIPRGLVKNPYKATFCKKGCLGQGKYNSMTHPKESSTWVSMIDRCYGKQQHRKHPSYLICEVSSRWLNFQNFCEDIQHLEGYAEWKVGENNYQLDKDIKNKNNRNYSKDTCIFVPFLVNLAEMHNRIW